MEETTKSKFLNLNLEKIMSEDFAKYAKYIIQDRALPDIRDGLKPVQRRIIYAMRNLNLLHNLPHKKSARTVGEVIGKYHPHGDSSIYDAMVRMSQPWKNNSILIDMHGNNGSIDGDSAAAMRYTECRLSQYSQLMTDNLEKNTVKFMNNFDDSDQEPTVLPTLLPNLLINGANGIAAGYATNIPPFSLNEVIDAVITRIDSPNCHLQSIINVMPGPDFPTSGVILNQKGIYDAYASGKGKIIVRGNIQQVSANMINITSIPFEVNKSMLVRQIDEIKDKYDVLGIKEVRDESDRNGVCIAIETVNGKNFEVIKNILCKETQLQISYSMNMIAIHNRKPIQFTIFQALDAFIEHANNVIVSSSKYDLEKSLKKHEVIVGLIKATKIIDDIVYRIKNSKNKDEAKQRIIDELNFSELQAESIINLRLYKLSNTDVNELNSDLIETNQQIEELKLLISNNQYRNNHIKNNLRNYKKIFGRKRLSSFSNEDTKIKIDEFDTIKDRNVMIICSKDGYLKSLSNQTYKAIDYQTIALKPGDLPISILNSNFRDKLILITSKGNYISLPTHMIEQTKWKDVGVHINKFVNIGANEKIISCFNFSNNVNNNDQIILCSKNGQIKRTNISYLKISKSVKMSKIIPLQDDDFLVSCLLENKNINNKHIVVVNSLGYAYAFRFDELKELSLNAAGVKAMNIDVGEKIAGICVFDKEKDLNNLFLLTSSSGMKRMHYSEIPILNRPSKGKSIFLNVKSNPSTIDGVYNINLSDLIHCIDETQKINFIKPSDIPIGDKQTRLSKISNKKLINTSVIHFNKNSNENFIFQEKEKN